jgi:hypothetical protein
LAGDAIQDGGRLTECPDRAIAGLSIQTPEYPAAVPDNPQGCRARTVLLANEIHGEMGYAFQISQEIVRTRRYRAIARHPQVDV